ncbi:hypothetical protein GALMADRAFT_252100 [Galerina marginata CBS 339.88]|uniref:TPR-like protein n=1 Tax=Galerina marginata (strain CBS 339.88) TaxID=685588 RepID=A0A067SPJ4_GALM3|nr:hypothetical protein GALMADRAFT_252100 [Galerina marginata CBS 339.88]
MSTPKERHYWFQLRAVLTAGQWRSEFPAKAYNASPLSWPELFRKFKKHCHGYEDVAEVAAQTRSLALLLSLKYKDDDEDGDMEDDGPAVNEGKEDEAWRRGRVALASECILQPERTEEAEAGHEVLKSLQSSKFDTIYFALAYYSYALGNPTECISYLSRVPELLQFQNHIPSPESTRSNANHGLQVPSTYATSTTSFTGSFASIADTTAPEVRDGRAWALTETFRSLCLQGMSYERLHRTDPQRALEAYLTALPLFSALRSEFTTKAFPKPISPNGKPDFLLFSQLREMWRWVERLLWRAIVLSAKTCDIFVDGDAIGAPATSNATSGTQRSLWTWFEHYITCSAFWPPTFRTTHRSTICALHLRALVLRYGVLVSLPAAGMAPVYAQPMKSNTVPGSRTASAPNSRPPTALSNSHSTGPSVGQVSTSASSTTIQPHPLAQSSWMHTARSIVQDYRAILDASTSFPRAGERNVKVEEFVELCVKVWEAAGAAGEQVGWVIEILNWSQRLTFNSSLVLRHLTRLLYLGSAPYLAKKTLKLYIQVVGKAWEASKEGVGEDMDDDARWVETLVFGARMLCAGVGGPGGAAINLSSGSSQGAPTNDDGTEGIEDVLEASSVLEKARTRLDENDKRLVADVLLAEGIVWGLLGVKGHDPLSRPTNFDKAHACLLRSIQAHSTPSAYYNLALSFARRIPGAGGISADSRPNTDSSTIQGHEHSLDRAIECAGHAVEGSPKDVRYWHLLGLLLSATEKWSAAKEILERGAELDDDEDESTDVDEDPALGGDDDSEEEESTRGRGNREENGGSEDADTIMQVQAATLTLKVPETNVVVKATDFAPTRTPKKQKSSINDIGVPDANGNGAESNVPSGGTLLLQPGDICLPPAASLQHSAISLLYSPPSEATTSSYPSVPSLSIDQYPPTTADLFERHLQLRMTQVALIEVVEGPEGAEEGWLEVFSWVAEKRGVGIAGAGGSTPGGSQPRQSLDDSRQPHSIDFGSTNLTEADTSESGKARVSAGKRMYRGLASKVGSSSANEPDTESLSPPVGIIVLPATPNGTPEAEQMVQLQLEKVEKAQMRVQAQRSYESLLQTTQVVEWNGEKYSGEKENARDKEKEKEKDKKSLNGSNVDSKLKRSFSSDRGGDTFKSKKKVQQILKGSVHKGRAGITAVSRRIGHGVVKNPVLRRSTSTPDFHAVLHPTSYQASSIHSRRRLSSIIHSGDRTPNASPPPPPPPSLPTSGGQQDSQLRNQRSAKENRLLSDLWLMSAATFRRLGKIEQAKGSIQEAEVRDENNPNVWVQLGLYYVSLGLYQHAVDTLQKARFISSDDVAATVHLSRLYLDPKVTRKIHSSSNQSSTSPPSSPRTASHSSIPTYTPSSSPDVDLAVGMLAHLTKGRGWDVPEAWYYLANAYGMQGRKEKERETLKVALEFSEKRGVRDIGSALGWCV